MFQDYMLFVLASAAECTMIGGVTSVAIVTYLMFPHLKTWTKGALVDVQSATSPRCLLNFVLNGLGNEYQKWFGHSPLIWDLMYSNCDYATKMISSTQNPRYVSIRDAIKQNGSSGSSILDIGCGTANALPIWSEAGLGSYTGIDISSRAIEIARETYGTLSNVQTTFLTCAMQDFQAEPETFDVAIFNESLYYVSSPSEALQLSTRAWELLRKGGCLIISMSNTAHAAKIWQELKGHFPMPTLSEALHEGGNEWTVATYTKL
jgi:2-polyprenyl-3-methyl-5-hydroxy-6-metoxy-1,4-benzoquinol methylase/Flp pilus assembly pilin Flp